VRSRTSPAGLASAKPLAATARPTGAFSPSQARRKQPPPFENGWRRRAGSPPRRPCGGVTLFGLREPSPDGVGAPSDHPARRRRESGPIRLRNDHQPRSHGPGAGMLCCQQPLVRSDAYAVPRTQSSVHGRPCAVPLAGDWERLSIPTRSARTPLVVRPGHRRLETPTTARRCLFRGGAPSTIPPHEPHPREG